MLSIKCFRETGLVDLHIISDILSRKTGLCLINNKYIVFYFDFIKYTLNFLSIFNFKQKNAATKK